jgi:hypothetical protein
VIHRSNHRGSQNNHPFTWRRSGNEDHPRTRCLPKHCKSARTIDLNSVAIRDGIRGNPNATIIPERDIYRLIMRTKLPLDQRLDESLGKNPATGVRWIEKTSRKVQEAKTTRKPADYSQHEICEIIAPL